jgi:hypothetical protein
MSLLPNRTTLLRSLAAALSVPALALSILQAAPAGAVAAERAESAVAPVVERRGICDPGEWFFSVGRPTIAHAVTHAKILERYTGGTTTQSVKTRRVLKLSARVSGSARLESGGSAKVFKLFSAEARTEFNVNVATLGSVTSSSRRKVTDRLPGNDTYVFYAGKNKYTSSWRATRCTSSGRSYQLVATGKVRSYAVDVDGAVGCYRQSPSSRSMAATVQRLYC